MYDIDIKDKHPIYLQIVDQTIEMMADGRLRDGDRMISIRELATILGINPATVSKAYRELEDRGFIETEKGRGTFVSFSKSSMENEQKIAIEKFKELVSDLNKLNLSETQLIDVIKNVYEKGEK